MRPPDRTDQEDSLLADIAAKPEEDTSRRVYADWLEDWDPQDPRAEFLRIQCELAAMPMGNEGWYPLKAREAVLYEQVTARWRALLATRGVPVEYLDVRNGVPDFVGMEMANFPRFAEGLFRLVPVTRLQVSRSATDTGQEVCDFLASPLLSRVRELYLSGNRLGDDGVKAVAACPNLTGLRELSLERNNIAVNGAAALGAASTLAELEALSLNGNDLADDGVEEFVAAEPNMPRLRRLDLGGNGVGAAGIEALEALRLELRAIDLGRNPLGNEGAARVLAATPWPKTLEWLGLSECEFRNAEAEVLTTMVLLFPNGFTTLDLAKNRIGPVGIRALMASATRRGITITGLDHQRRWRRRDS